MKKRRRIDPAAQPDATGTSEIKCPALTASKIVERLFRIGNVQFSFCEQAASSIDPPRPCRLAIQQVPAQFLDSFNQVNGPGT